MALAAMGLIACKNDTRTPVNSADAAPGNSVEMVQPETYVDAVQKTQEAAVDLGMTIVQTEALVKSLPPAKAKLAQPLLEDLRAMEAKYQGAIQEFQTTAGQSFGAYVDPNSDMAQDPNAIKPRPVPASQVKAAMEAHKAYVDDINNRIKELSEQIRQIAQ